MKKITKILSALALALLIMAPAAALAQDVQPQIKSEVVMKVGNKLHLFHSGTKDVKKEICVGDVLPVYRDIHAGGSLKVERVGRVKVLSYVGEHYIEAEIVDGDIKVGDIAKKKTASCIVTPPE